MHHHPDHPEGIWHRRRVCINIDANYLTEDVLQDAQKVRAWFENFLRVDLPLDENILSRDEFAQAQKGKRHWKDDRAL